MNVSIFGRKIVSLVFTVFWCFSPLYGQDSQRVPIDINLIIDSSEALSSVKDEINAWVTRTIVDQMLTAGDRITVWSAGASAKAVFSGRISGAPDKENIKKAIREITASGEKADFSGALKEAASAKSSGLSYTLLISVSPAALSSVLAQQANLLRYSRVEEFSKWRVLVVGLDLDTKVKKAASAFMGF
ncbi:MAG: hypothetical protein LBH44_00750 [Treponema sp.]|jgi:hypothetical protein|nr:hypothetical protein [Treponema sp.]